MTDFTEKFKKRRSYREFESTVFDINILIESIETAKYSPSGANKQPWTFCIIKNPELKRKIRIESEKIEEEFYKKISDTWNSDLKALYVNTKKPFLEKAPYLIVIFSHKYELLENGQKSNVYYPDISIGIATGVLISALVDMGIDTLTYTPSPNHFLKDILDRPDNEKPYMVIVCGIGSNKYKLPDITKKTSSDIIKVN